MADHRRPQDTVSNNAQSDNVHPTGVLESPHAAVAYGPTPVGRLAPVPAQCRASFLTSLALSAILGCGSVKATMPDAPTSPNACDPLGPFDVPRLLAGIDSGTSAADAVLSADELTLYLTRSAVAGDHDLYVAARPRVTDAFGAPIPLTSLNSTSDDASPSISSDGLTLMFQSNRVTAEGQHLYVTTRGSQIADFDTPAPVASVRSPVTTKDDFQPFLTGDGEELWFISNRNGNDDVFRAAKAGAGFADPVSVPELSGPDSEQHVVLSLDRLTVYFASNRPTTPGGSPAGFNIYRSHRSTVQDGFGAPTLVGEVNTASDDYPTWLSADSCRLYLHSRVSGTFNIFVAIRRPPS